MATLVEIDDGVAREARAIAERAGSSLARFVEDAILRVVSDRPAEGRTTGPVVIPVFRGGGGVVDGLTLEQAVERADLELDLAIAASGDDQRAPV